MSTERAWPSASTPDQALDPPHGGEPMPSVPDDHQPHHDTPPAGPAAVTLTSLREQYGDDWEILVHLDSSVVSRVQSAPAGDCLARRAPGRLRSLALLSLRPRLDHARRRAGGRAPGQAPGPEPAVVDQARHRGARVDRAPRRPAHLGRDASRSRNPAQKCQPGHVVSGTAVYWSSQDVQLARDARVLEQMLKASAAGCR